MRDQADSLWCSRASWSWDADYWGRPCFLTTSSHKKSTTNDSFNTKSSKDQDSDTRLKAKVAQSCLTLWSHGLYSPWNSPAQNTGMGSLSLLQGIFQTQGSNPGLSTLQVDSLPVKSRCSFLRACESAVTSWSPYGDLHSPHNGTEQVNIELILYID